MIFSRDDLHGCDEKLAARPRFRETHGQARALDLDLEEDHLVPKIKPQWELQRRSASLLASLHLPMVSSAELAGGELVLTEGTIAFSAEGLVMAEATLPMRVDISRCSVGKFSWRTRTLRVRVSIIDVK